MRSLQPSKEWFIFGFASLISFVLVVFFMDRFGLLMDDWPLLILIAMAGVWILLYMNKRSPSEWLLVPCLGGFLLCAATLARGHTIDAPLDPDTMIDPYADYASAVSPDIDESKLLYYGDGATTQITLLFPAVESLEGQWEFVEGEVKVSGALNGTYRPNEEAYGNMGQFEPNNQSSLLPAEPQLILDLPLTERHLNEKIQLDAALTVAYWVLNDEEEVEQVEATLERELDVEVIDYEMLMDDMYSNAMDYEEMYLSPTSYEDKLEQYRKVKKAVDEIPGTPALAAWGAISLATGGFLLWGMQPQRNPVYTSLKRNSGARIPSLTGTRGPTLARAEWGADLVSLDTSPVMFKNPDLRGVLVERVKPQSVAGRAGLLMGDIIQTFGNQTVTHPKHVRQLVVKQSPGSTLTAKVWRSGETITLTMYF